MTINIETNCELSLLKVSSILFNQRAFTDKHNFIAGDFDLINSNQFKLTPLQNMDGAILGLN